MSRCNRKKNIIRSDLSCIFLFLNATLIILSILILIHGLTIKIDFFDSLSIAIVTVHSLLITLCIFGYLIFFFYRKIWAMISYAYLLVLFFFCNYIHYVFIVILNYNLSIIIIYSLALTMKVLLILLAIFIVDYLNQRDEYNEKSEQFEYFNLTELIRINV